MQPEKYANRRIGWHHSEETKRKISEANKGRHRSEETRRKLSQLRKGRHFSPNNEFKKGQKPSEETRKKMSESSKKAWANPERLRKASEKMKLYRHSPEAKKKLSESNKRRWANPEERRRWSISLKIAHNTPEYLTAAIKRSTGIKHTQETKQIISEKAKGRKPSIEARKKMSASHKNWYCSPENSQMFKKIMSNSEIRKKISIARMRQIFPSKDTLIELKMQNILREHAIPFITHKPITGQPDLFIEPNICIFCDGDFFHCNPKKYDKPISIIQEKHTKRDVFVNAELIKQGYIILRFWEADIHNDIDTCFEKIKRVLPAKSDNNLQFPEGTSEPIAGE